MQALKEIDDLILKNAPEKEFEKYRKYLKLKDDKPGEDIKKPRVIITKDQREEIKALLREGYSLRLIGIKLNINPNTLKSFIDRNNIPYLTRQEIAIANRKKVYDYVQQNYTNEEIAEKLNLSTSTIKKYRYQGKP